MVQNRPKFDIYISPHFYSRYVNPGYLPCEKWLWLYNTIQWERREQAFLADDEWSGSSRCVYTWDGIATRFCPLQFENCTCTLYSRNDTRVNDAHLQTLLSDMQKRTKMSQRVKKFKFVLASLPPCTSVMNTTQASQSWLIHGNMPIWTTSHAGNQLSMDGNFPTACDQMPQEVLCEDDGSPNDNNDTGDECKTPSTMFNEMF